VTVRLLLLISLGLSAGCGSEPSTSPLRVAVASDLQSAMPVLISAFRSETKLDVEAVYGVSGHLAQQIKAGAPFDLFLSANRVFVDDLAKSGSILPDSVRPYTKGTLVLVVNNLFDPGVKTLADIASDKVKSIAIANPDLAPYGAAAKQALERAGLWEKVQPKLVIAESVRQALQFVESGNAEVGFVGKAIAGVKGVRTIPLAPDAYDPIVQGMGIVAESRRGGDAAKFAEFLLGDSGQGILRDFGFQSIGKKP
jgi:molybdate transport system substrate-binding protein